MKLWKKKKENQEQQNSTNVPAALKETLRREGILTMVAVTMLIILIIIAALAWYTKLTVITGLTFDTADFDFNANYVTDSFIVNVDDYINSVSGKAAPGTSGVIPIRIAPEDSAETDMVYSISLDYSSMAPEFYERIQFYYYIEDEQGIISKEVLGTMDQSITGTIQMGDSLYEYIYWEWRYEANIDTLFTGTNGSVIYTDIDDMTGQEIYNMVKAWNNAEDTVEDTEVDTEVGTEVDTEEDTVSTGTKAYLELVEDGAYDFLADTYIMALYNNKESKGDLTVPALTYYGYEIEGTTYLRYSGKSQTDIGNDIRDYILTYIYGPWDIIDTNVALGEFDQTFESSNGKTYEATVDDSGIVLSTAYQEAMQVGLYVTGAQAEPQDIDEVQNPTLGTTVFKPY